MRAGDKITIYEDPLTMQKPEGVAILKKKDIQDSMCPDDPCEWWWVRFESENGLFLRKILKPNQQEGN